MVVRPNPNDDEVDEVKEPNDAPEAEPAPDREPVPGGPSPDPKTDPPTPQS